MTLLKGGSGETLKFKSLLKTTTLALALSCSVSAVFAISVAPPPPVVPTAGVARTNGTGPATTTFISPDPGYSNSTLTRGGGSSVTFGPQPSFIEQVPQNAGTQGNGGTKCGWNFPALHAGLLPATTGDLLLMEGFYSIAGTNQASTDPGFRVIIQTSDGKYHASSTKLASSHTLISTVNNNSRTLWQQFPFAADFNPALVSGPGAQVVKVAWGFYGNSSCQLINQIIPPVSTDKSFGFKFLDGSIQGIVNDPAAGTACTFSINPTVDTQFNFELSTNNN